MLRFSIRDLLWLTLVVAMGLGWGIREWQRDDSKWQNAFHSLEYAINLEGYRVEADFDSSSTVKLYKRNEGGREILSRGVKRKD